MHICSHVMIYVLFSILNAFNVRPWYLPDSRSLGEKTAETTRTLRTPPDEEIHCEGSVYLVFVLNKLDYFSFLCEFFYVFMKGHI